MSAEMMRGIVSVFWYALRSLRDYAARFEVRLAYEESDLVVVLLRGGQRLAKIFIARPVTGNPPDSAV